MKNILKIALLSGCVSTALLSEAKEFRVVDYGVSTDSTIVQTAKLQSVIDIAEAEGGGEVVLTKGTYLSGALFFKPGTSLVLQDGAVLKGSDNIEDYPLIPSRMEGRSIYYHAALVNAYHVDGFKISGTGTINGNGYKFWVQFWNHVEKARVENRAWTNLEVRRPRLVFLWGCDNVVLSGVRLINSAFWTTHLYQCQDVLIENCEVYAPAEPVRAPSSDAIDLDGCRRVTVRGCYLNCDDDGVCMKGGKGVFAHKSMENGMVEDILVENCTFGPNLHGTITLGSECFHAKNIVLRNCKLENECSLLRLKMRPDTYQTYENITIENVTGKCGTLIEMLPWKQFFTLEGTNEHPIGVVKNVTMKNINVSCDNLGAIAGNKDDSVTDFRMENITVKAASDVFHCNYPTLKLINVKVNGHAPIIVTADEDDKDKLNYDLRDLDKANEK
jgi:polygalacturonase